MSPDKTQSNNSHDYKRIVSQMNDNLSLFFNRRRQEKLKIHNPFVYEWNIKWYEWIKMGILSVLFLPIKLVLVAFWLLIAMIISSIITVNQDHNIPFKRWQKKLLPFFNVAARLTFFAGGIFYVRIKGQLSKRKDIPILVIAPHSAFLDTLIVVCLGNKSVLGKMESANSCIGCFVKITQPVLVDRDDPNSRQTVLDEVERRARLPNIWPQVVIFPEGTCTNRTCLINFKTGAFHGGHPVQPIVVRWPNTVDSVTWTWDGPGIFKLVWMTLTQFYINLEIECLEPYYPSAAEKNDPKLYAYNVRDVMATALNIPVTDYSYEDCRHMTMAKKAGLPFSEIIVELNKLRQFLSETYETVDMSISKLLEINKNFGDKKISAAEFSSFIQLKGPLIEGINSIFKFYDKSKTGSIFLRDLLSHMFYFILPFERKQALTYSLQAYTDVLCLDKQKACGDVLQHVFSLTYDEVNEIFLVIKSDDGKKAKSITIDSVEETLSLLNGPFNMYTDYFTIFNRSKRSKPPRKVTETKFNKDEVESSLKDSTIKKLSLSSKDHLSKSSITSDISMQPSIKRDNFQVPNIDQSYDHLLAVKNIENIL